MLWHCHEERRWGDTCDICDIYYNDENIQTYQGNHDIDLILNLMQFDQIENSLLFLEYPYLELDLC